MAQITVQQYADKFDVTTVAVTRACKKEKKLKGIAGYKKLGRDWVLVTADEYDTIEVTPGEIVEKTEKTEADF